MVLGNASLYTINVLYKKTIHNIFNEDVNLSNIVKEQLQAKEFI